MCECERQRIMGQGGYWCCGDVKKVKGIIGCGIMGVQLIIFSSMPLLSNYMCIRVCENIGELRMKIV